MNSKVSRLNSLLVATYQTNEEVAGFILVTMAMTPLMPIPIHTSKLILILTNGEMPVNRNSFTMTQLMLTIALCYGRDGAVFEGSDSKRSKLAYDNCVKEMISLEEEFCDAIVKLDDIDVFRAAITGYTFRHLNALEKCLYEIFMSDTDYKLEECLTVHEIGQNVDLEEFKRAFELFFERKKKYQVADAEDDVDNVVFEFDEETIYTNYLAHLKLCLAD